MTEAEGCGFDPQKGPALHRVGIAINGNSKILLGKFEVCNSQKEGIQSCFDVAYEKAKLQASKSCVNGKCEA
jgi:hypothetical protein